MILFYVSMKVRPVPWHPMFYQWQFGFLNLLLFGENPDDVAEKARVIVGALPYEFSDEDGIKVVPQDKCSLPIGAAMQHSCRPFC